MTPAPPDAGPLRSDRRPESPLDQSPQTGRSAGSARSRVPLRRKRPAGTQGDGDIDEPSVVTGRARWLDHHAASEIDAPGPCLTPTCGGRTRRPRTEEWPLPDDHPRRVCQLGALDPRSPITEEGLTTVPVPPPTIGSCDCLSGSGLSAKLPRNKRLFRLELLTSIAQSESIFSLFWPVFSLAVDSAHSVPAPISPHKSVI